MYLCWYDSESEEWQYNLIANSFSEFWAGIQKFRYLTVFDILLLLFYLLPNSKNSDISDRT